MEPEPNQKLTCIWGTAITFVLPNCYLIPRFFQSLPSGGNDVFGMTVLTSMEIFVIGLSALVYFRTRPGRSE
jgi:hypothetical protein